MNPRCCYWRAGAHIFLDGHNCQGIFGGTAALMSRSRSTGRHCYRRCPPSPFSLHATMILSSFSLSKFLHVCQVRPFYHSITALQVSSSNISIVRMTRSIFSMVLLIIIVCSISGTGTLLRASACMAQEQVTPAGSLALSAASRNPKMTLDQPRDLGSSRPNLRALFLTSGRRLLQSIPSQAGSSGKISLGGIIGFVIGISIFIGVILALVVVYVKFRRIRTESPTPPQSPVQAPEDDSTYNSQITCSSIVSSNGIKSFIRRFASASSTMPMVWLSSACEMEFFVLQTATDNFSDANLLGEGGSGRVYRAKLNDSDFGAVKVIDQAGRHALAEFQSEVDLMRQVRHPNLVSLLGYCNQGERRLLVYELMVNGSLEGQLYGARKGNGLSWNLRIKIALDSARGLEYLHERSVVHRDFKASNILLDANFNAKVSDFGLATPLEGLTHEESLQLIGTIGYVAPEYFASGNLTEKSDVYAFGVTLLELLTGRKPVDHSLPLQEQSLVNWATPQLTDRNKLPKLLPSHLRESLNLKHLYQVAAVAALCVQKEPTYRPLIADVVQSLVPLVPVDLGGALKSDSIPRSGSFYQQYRDKIAEEL